MGKLVFPSVDPPRGEIAHWWGKSERAKEEERGKEEEEEEGQETMYVVG